MEVKFANISFAIFILVMNFYFLPSTIEIIFEKGGPMGVAIIALPFLILVNIFIIPAILVLIKKYRSDKLLLTLNIVGSSFILLFIFFTLNLF